MFVVCCRYNVKKELKVFRSAERKKINIFPIHFYLIDNSKRAQKCVYVIKGLDDLYLFADSCYNESLCDTQYHMASSFTQLVSREHNCFLLAFDVYT